MYRLVKSCAKWLDYHLLYEIFKRSKAEVRYRSRLQLWVREHRGDLLVKKGCLPNVKQNLQLLSLSQNFLVKFVLLLQLLLLL